MFARLLIYDNVDLVLVHQLQAWMETTQADPPRETAGYRGSMQLVDRDNARMVRIELHATSGHARDTHTLAGTLCRQLRADVPRRLQSALDIRPDSAELYEIVYRD